MCFKCGEKWSHQYKCPPTVSLHAIEQVWSCVNEVDEHIPQPVQQDSDFDDNLMALSVQALNGTKDIQTIRLRGIIEGRKAFMLIDSGSTHGFINEQFISHLTAGQLLPQPVKVKVANGNYIQFTHHLPHQLWGIQGHTF